MAVAEWYRAGPRAQRRLVARLRRPGAAPHGRPAVRREPAPGGGALQRPRRAGRARPGRAVARQGDVLQQLRRRRRRLACGARLRRPVRGHHQACQPVRHRGRRRRGRGAPQGARLRPGVGVRWRHRHQRAGQRGDGRAARRDLHRGARRAVLCRRCRSTCWPRAEEPPRAAGAGVVTGGRRSSGRCPAACWCRPRTASTRPATPGRPGGWCPAIRPTRRPWPTWCSPGGRCARSSPTRSCSPPTGPPSASVWARSTGSTRPGSR